jgi:hypothetical protein
VFRTQSGRIFSAAFTRAEQDASGKLLTVTYLSADLEMFQNVTQ